MKTVAPSPSSPPPFGRRLLSRLKKIGISVLLGAAPAGLMGLALDRILWKVIIPGPYIFDAVHHPFPGVAAYGIYTLNYLPAALIRRIYDLIFHPRELDKVVSLDHLVWLYTRSMSILHPAIYWGILGAFLGVLVLSWSKRPFKLFLKINAVLAISATLIASLFLISEIKWFRREAAIPTPPLGLEMAAVNPPPGFERREISPGDHWRRGGQKPQPGLPKRDKSWHFDYDGEILLTFAEAGTEYRLIYNYPFIKNDPAESFEYYSADKICPWVYSLWTKKKREHCWTLLGPFLPCVGLQDFPVLDLDEGVMASKEGTLQWVVRERDREKQYDEDFPAHVRQAKKGGRAWSCSLPLSLYTQDSDNDNLTDVEETALLTDPFKDDTDGDGVIDGQDSSPHGWFISKTGADGMERCVLEYVFRNRKYYMDMDRPSLIVVPYEKYPPHLDVLDYKVMTLSPAEEERFRTWNGTGKTFVICSMDVSRPKTLLFGSLGLLVYWDMKGPTAGVGYIAFCVRKPNKEWKPFHFYMYAIS